MIAHLRPHRQGLCVAIVILALLVSLPVVHAATGIYQPIHYQGKVNLIGGSAVGNGAYNMQFKIYDALTNGTLLWTETWNGDTQQVTMTGGLFSVALGTYSAMTTVNFNTDNLYLQVEFDPGNDGIYEEVFSPRRRFGSVPYAHNADRLDGLDGSQLLRTDARNTTTGSLLVNTGGLAIRTPGTISGGVLHATRLLSTSGSLRITSAAVTGLGAASVLAAEFQTGAYLSASGATVLALNSYDVGTAAPHITFGYQGTFDTKLYRSAAAQLSTNGSLYVLGTLSGAQFGGAGLTHCDPVTGKLTWNSTSKTFVCGTDGGGTQETGTASFSGAVVTLGNARYVLKAGSTMTGALVIQNGNSHTPTVTSLLNVRGTMSGQMLRILNGTTNTGAFISQNGDAIALAIKSTATSNPGLRISMPTQNASANPHILFGYDNTFDTKLYRSGVAQITVKTETDASNIDVFRILSNVSTTDNVVFRVESDGDVRADGTVQGGGADYAEWFASKDALTQGEIVCIDVTRNHAVQRCERDGDINLMGIVSTKPAFVGNAFWGLSGIRPPGYHLIGLIGQVPAKITNAGGTIRAGDSLTAAAVPGFARKAKTGESTVGIALEAFDGETGVINVLISRRNQSLTVEAVEEKIVERIAAMQIEDDVRFMITEALGDLTVEDTVKEAVRTQIDTLAFQDAIEALKHRMDVIEAREVVFETGSTVEMQSGTGMIVVETQNLASLRGTSMELNDTLLVGTDARIGGDLYLDGSLIMESLYVPGSIDIENTVHAGRIEAGSGSQIAGALILDGELRMGTGSIRFQNGAIAIDDLFVENSLMILGDVTIHGLTRFFGVVEIFSELRLPTKQAGRTQIESGKRSVAVSFDRAFSAIPVVTASPEEFVSSPWRIQPVTATGFTIELQQTAINVISFAWHAFVTVDSLGIPVSSDVVTPVIEVTDSAANVEEGLTRTEPKEAEEEKEAKEAKENDTLHHGTGAIVTPSTDTGTTVTTPSSIPVVTPPEQSSSAPAALSVSSTPAVAETPLATDPSPMTPAESPAQISDVPALSVSPFEDPVPALVTE